MCSLHSITANQAAITALLRVMNQQLAANAECVSGLSGPSGAQR
jgi:hypothetical protein